MKERIWALLGLAGVAFFAARQLPTTVIDGSKNVKQRAWYATYHGASGRSFKIDVRKLGGANIGFFALCGDDNLEQFKRLEAYTNIRQLSSKYIDEYWSTNNFYTVGRDCQNLHFVMKNQDFIDNPMDFGNMQFSIHVQKRGLF